jgi:hypothetical protein
MTTEVANIVEQATVVDVVEAPKRKRGRPRKVVADVAVQAEVGQPTVEGAQVSTTEATTAKTQTKVMRKVKKSKKQTTKRTRKTARRAIKRSRKAVVKQVSISTKLFGKIKSFFNR